MVDCAGRHLTLLVKDDLKIDLGRLFKTNEENLGGETSEKMLPTKDSKGRLFPHSLLDSKPRIAVQLKSSAPLLVPVANI